VPKKILLSSVLLGAVVFAPTLKCSLSSAALVVVVEYLSYVQYPGLFGGQENSSMVKILPKVVYNGQLPQIKLTLSQLYFLPFVPPLISLQRRSGKV